MKKNNTMKSDVMNEIWAPRRPNIYKEPAVRIDSDVIVKGNRQKAIRQNQNIKRKECKTRLPEKKTQKKTTFQ